MCLPTSLQCDGVDYCTDDSTSHVLCRESVQLISSSLYR